jgi:hypothetical protein
LALATLSNSIALTSTKEHPLDVPRDRLAGRLRRADLVADYRGVVCYNRVRRIADRFGLLRHVWHPALFIFALYIIVLSSMVLVIAR